MMNYKAKFKCEVCGRWFQNCITLNKGYVIGIVCHDCFKNPNVGEVLAFNKAQNEKHKQINIYELFENETLSKKKVRKC